jgi:ABC-2 type transport system ATP-binding protein
MLPVTEASPALDIRGLSKSYRIGHLRGKRRPALRDLTLQVPRGAVFGCLGPNGSGKSTTLKLLLGLIFPDSGDAVILGHPIGARAARQSLGYLPENPYFYDYLTPREYLDYAGRLFGLSPGARRDRARELLDLVGITPAADVQMRRFSKGMLQRLGLAQALVNRPELVFLDEPMSGLDPLGRRSVREIILKLKAEGSTVFFSTHILPDAETLCDEVAVLRGGSVVAKGRLDQILTLDVSHMEVLVSGLAPPDLSGLPAGVETFRTMGERLVLQVPEKQLGGVVVAVEQRGGRVLSVQPVRQSLEDFFVAEMGQPAKGEAWTAGA